MSPCQGHLGSSPLVPRTRALVIPPRGKEVPGVVRGAVGGRGCDGLRLSTPQKGTGPRRRGLGGAHPQGCSCRQLRGPEEALMPSQGVGRSGRYEVDGPTRLCLPQDSAHMCVVCTLCVPLLLCRNTGAPVRSTACAVCAQTWARGFPRMDLCLRLCWGWTPWRRSLRIGSCTCVYICLSFTRHGTHMRVCSG